MAHRLDRVGLTATVMFAAASFGATGPALAQGYSLYEQGACAMGRAGAGVAAPCADGSAIFFNPAGLASALGTVASVGGTAIAPRGQFTHDASGLVSALNQRTFLAPTAYFAKSAGRRTMVGVGIFAPYGLKSDWPPTSEGRFLGYLSSLKSLYVQPTVGVRLSDRILIGAGIDVTHVRVELRRRLDLAAVPLPGAPSGVTFHTLAVPQGTDFADVDLEGSGNHVGAHFGVIVHATDRLSFGGRYLLRQRVGINGHASASQITTGIVLGAPVSGLPAGTPLDSLVAPQFATGQPLSAQVASTTLPLPDQLVMGVALRTSRRSQVFVDYQFTKWSLFDQVLIQNQFAPSTVLVESYNDTHGVFAGGEYSLREVVLRAGFAGRTAAAPDQSVTPLLPDAPRWIYAAGASVPLRRHVRADLAYEHVRLSDRRGRTTDGGLAIPTAAINDGLYHYYGNLFGVSLVFGF